MTPEQLQKMQQLEADLDWQTERANGAVNRFKELQSRIDGALAYLRYRENYTSVARDAIKILTGEGE